ncbi:MAG: orotidine-5'-phosphate decarboxylase [Patescibacteria group bacterium UBA2103]
MKKHKPVILALDGLSPDKAISLAKELQPYIWGIKGNDLFDQISIQEFKKRVPGIKIMADLKLHDIPSTVGRRVKAQKVAGAEFITIHIQGGKEMATEALKAAGKGAVILGVTKLTSESASKFDMQKLSKDALRYGLHGIVCSGKDLPFLPINKFSHIVTPGIRSLKARKDDQKRVATPQEALKNGATHIVIGREVTKSSNPKERMLEIYESL